MRIVHIYLVLILFAVVATAQNQRGPSTPEERDRAVQIAHESEMNPLDPALRSQRQWLLKWAADVPDITVSICASHQEFKKKYKYSPELTFQKLASATAFVIEHPEQKNDKSAEELAAVEGALRAYQAILKSGPTAHSPYWDDLLQKQTAGTLKDFVYQYHAAECNK